jgi:hypothetical protein
MGDASGEPVDLTPSLTVPAAVTDGPDGSSNVAVVVDLAGKHARRIWPQE